MPGSGTVLRSALLAAALAAPGGQAAAQAPAPPEVRYRLRAAIADSEGWISGSAEVHYRHRAPGLLAALPLSLPYNAFRPGSRVWPTDSLTEPDQSGFQRLGEVQLDGRPARVEWPVAPDSSTAMLVLEQPLAPGDSVVVTLAWTARPPAVPWRLDRAGRRMDLIGWYPRIIDGTSGTSEPFPAFATVLLDLTLADDQVIGGTGIPLCGDPGWEAASPRSNGRVTLLRTWYKAPRDPAAARAECGTEAQGLKRLVWYAEDVTELALVMSPTFRHEEGDFLAQPVHALYERGAERVWGAGLATRRAETALAWVAELGALNPWPHLLVAPRLGGSGQALPMLLLAEVPTQAALLELLGLMMTQQVMAGGASVFTVGTAAFQAAWFFEVLGRRDIYSSIEREVLDWDLDRLGLREERLGRLSSTSPCATTSCRRMEFTAFQLRRWAGSDPAIRNLYLRLYEQFRLKPTMRGAFQEAARELIQPSPDSLYAQVPRGGTLYDDAITAVRREPVAGGGWRTTVVVERRAAGVFPRTIWVVADSDTAVARARTLAPTESLTVPTRTRPRLVVLDPLMESHDWNMLNNRRGFRGGLPWLPALSPRPRDFYFDLYVSQPMSRDRLTTGIAPVAWYNDRGGWTFGLRVREDYLGRFEQNQLWAVLNTGWKTEGGRVTAHGRLVVRNPVSLRAAGWTQGLELAAEEGRVTAGVDAARRFRSRVTDSLERSLGWSARWLTVSDPAWIDRRQYDDAGTVELSATGRIARAAGRWPYRMDVVMGGGYAYPNAGSGIAGGEYARLSFTASSRGPSGRGWGAGLRIFGGTVITGDSIPRQRRIFLAGADPHERYGNPFLRSRGSLLAGSDMHYHFPGGAGVRGLDPSLTATTALGASLELEVVLRRGSPFRLFNRVALAGFADGALANGDLGSEGLVSVGDAGIGLRAEHRFRETRFVTRFDLPLWVSRPALAQDRHPARALGLRWSVSFLPSW